ncbi:hypothetical protein EKL30_09075 [Candidimonas sp. SYP-B2681]|uniref:family 16 glycoside hydrolase n=1 Tax=Candidimonas sp. SYP-B2681 TaxID=2497686 RepID=UPI000F889A91|nr:family 16 glycoside hydrolase [Candidimonas sp. SYP-B2681]RTZ44700.1 hypothetical protein EKL30_09075 [Candidimonas sp. SYP-B2681]
MKALIITLALFTTSTYAAAATVTFDADSVGQPPSDWTCGATGKGKPHWSIEPDASAPSGAKVLKQSGSATYPWCVNNAVTMADGAVEVKFKALAGKQDQAGGVVWRWKDGDNYYVARANALEGNVSLYYTINGSRKTLAYKDAPVAPHQWHTLRVVFSGTTIQVLLDGKKYIELQDNHIAGAGHVGVWTKADSVTLFGQFIYSASAP